jgi:putative DNA primase/helicase
LTAPDEVVRHARALARFDLAVVPLHPRREDGTCDCRKRDSCKTPGKHPRILWKDRPAEPPTDEELERWWRAWPDSGLGVILGDRLCALDVDHHPGGADGPAVLARLEAEHEPLPDTWHATSPAGGGGHLYFASHGRFASVHQVADGIQLRAGRHVMVLPPTYGRAWLTSPRQAPLADLPIWVANLAQQERRQSAGNGRYRVAEQLLPDDRHPTYVRVAIELARMRLPVEVIAEMLAVIDRRMARPPKDDPDELAAIAAWAVEGAA